METDCLSVMTRTRFTDYATRGTCGENFYEVLQTKPEWSGIAELMNTVMPAVLLLENNLFVTGIRSGRKDKVGRDIRWTFHLRKNDVSAWFRPLVNAFKTNEDRKLGDQLDRICGFSDKNDDFTAPALDTFLAVLPKPETEAGPAFRLWTDFVPAQESEMQEIVNNLAMPAGEIIIYDKGADITYIKSDIERQSSPDLKKKPISQTSQKRNLLLLLAAALLGAILVSWALLSINWEGNSLPKQENSVPRQGNSLPKQKNTFPTDSSNSSPALQTGTGKIDPNLPTQSQSLPNRTPAPNQTTATTTGQAPEATTKTGSE